MASVPSPEKWDETALVAPFSMGGNQEWLPYKIGSVDRTKYKLTRGLRKFRWKKPEKFAGGTPAIYIQQRYASLR
jgi:hypothetical protein